MLLSVLTTLLIAEAMGASAVTDQDTVEVALPQGIVEGVREVVEDPTSGSKFFYSFRGIPYAAPPVGELRFKDPAPPLKWSGVRKGMTPPMCKQVSFESFFNNKIEVTGDEDCLYLHVYSQMPKDSEMPVMVYIHGGGFVLGDADKFGGTPRPIVGRNIVLVSIQYRLGSLGFLSTGDSTLPGNYGLKDQTYALQWIHDNIRLFGGNPDMVTVFGISAGGASAHFHTVTPYSTGLFQRAISQSGTAICSWALRNDHAELALKMAKGFGCLEPEASSGESVKLLQCFNEASAEDLIMASIDTVIAGLPFRMVPRVDGDYIPVHPAQMIKEGRHNMVDLMSGVCQNEATGIIAVLLNNDTLKSIFQDNLKELGPVIAGMDHEDSGSYVFQRLFYHYLRDFEIRLENEGQFEKLLSDAFMSIWHDETTILHAQDYSYGKRTYRYELQHRAKFTFADMYNLTRKGTENWVSHGDDGLFLFDELFGSVKLNRSDDVFLKNIVVDLWTNFAKTGNPTPDLELGFKWEPMKSPEDLRYLSLVPAPRMREDNRFEAREFWKHLPVEANKKIHSTMFDRECH